MFILFLFILFYQKTLSEPTINQEKDLSSEEEPSTHPRVNWKYTHYPFPKSIESISIFQVSYFFN